LFCKYLSFTRLALNFHTLQKKEVEIQMNFL